MRTTNKDGSLRFFGIPKMIPLVMRFRKQVAVISLTALASGILDLLGPLFNRYALNHFVTEGTLDTLPLFIVLYVLMLALIGITAYINIKVQIAVDNDLCKNLYFADGVTPVLPMPSNYYTLSSTTMDYKGGFTGAVDVQLTDAFFNDPKALSNNYVIPVVMTSQTGADQILSGRTIIEGEQAQRTNAGRWDVAPKDYMLYCVKFISKYDANYLRRGVDQINFGGNTRNVVRHKGVENDEVKDDITTLGLNDVSYPVEVQVADGVYRNCTLRLSFDGSGKCTVSSMTDGVTASGSGSYNEKSEKKAWNNKDRDGLYLDYKINFADATVSTRDTLVWQSRGVVKEEFAPVYLEK